MLQPPRVQSDAPSATSWLELLLALAGRDVRRCVRCGGPVVTIALPRTHDTSAQARAPPA